MCLSPNSVNQLRSSLTFIVFCVFVMERCVGSCEVSICENVERGNGVVGRNGKATKISFARVSCDTRFGSFPVLFPCGDAVQSGTVPRYWYQTCLKLDCSSLQRLSEANTTVSARFSKTYHTHVVKTCENVGKETALSFSTKSAHVCAKRRAQIRNAQLARHHQYNSHVGAESTFTASSQHHQLLVALLLLVQKRDRV